MAFLCPAHIRRSKKFKDSDKLTAGSVPGIGRITGSASIETLVRAGLEKENGLAPDSKMVVLYDFTPFVDDELEVRRGQLVNILYQENDWIYVIGEDNQEGFIPHTYSAPVGSPLAKLALNIKHKKSLTNIKESDQEQSISDLDDQFASLTSAEVHPFFKDPSGHYIVLYTFIARDENDVSVERGESVTVLNKEDSDWYWVLRSDGNEGFVPASFVCPVDMVQEASLSANHTTSTSLTASNIHNASSSSNFFAANPNDTSNCNLEAEPDHHLSTPNMTATCSQQDLESRLHGTELVMLYDYKAQAPDDLSVQRGDFIYANLSAQSVDGWLWAYAPKIRKYGFIPKAYARPPAMTSL